MENSKFFPWHADTDNDSQDSPAEVSRLDNWTVGVTSLAQGAFCVYLLYSSGIPRVCRFNFLYLPIRNITILTCALFFPSVS